MNTHAEHHAPVRSGVLALLDKFHALMITTFKTWRAQQIERAELEALEALGPEVLEDIGVSLVETGRPPKSVAVCHPYVIAAGALSATRSKEHGEF